MIPDCHVHTVYSSDSMTPVEKQIDRAVELGMRYICVTDHQDYDALPLPPNNYTYLIGDIDDTPGYIKRLKELKDLYAGRIEVLIGVEIGLQGHLGKKLQGYTDEYQFDFVIGSSHYFDGYDGGDRRLYEGRSAEEACRAYFITELDNVKKCNCFDVIGHCDFVLRHAPGRFAKFKYSLYANIIDEMLKFTIENGKGIECNTGPLINGFGSTNPHIDILKRYKEFGGEIITFGSDAHSPENIGGKFKEAADLVKSIGFRHYTVYKQRKPIFFSF